MTRGYAAIGLDNPKTPVNVGHVLRAAGCYDASLVVLGNPRAQKQMVRACTDTQNTYKHVPVLTVDDVLDAIPFDCVPVAVDLVEGAQNLVEYKHPERAFYIFGAEDNTLGKRILDRCRDKIYVPTNRCMNLSACVNVVLYDRIAKQS